MGGVAGYTDTRPGLGEVSLVRGTVSALRQVDRWRQCREGAPVGPEWVQRWGGVFSPPKLPDVCVCVLLVTVQLHWIG